MEYPGTSGRTPPINKTVTGTFIFLASICDIISTITAPKNVAQISVAPRYVPTRYTIQQRAAFEAMTNKIFTGVENIRQKPHIAINVAITAATACQPIESILSSENFTSSGKPIHSFILNPNATPSPTAAAIINASIARATPET